MYSRALLIFIISITLSGCGTDMTDNNYYNFNTTLGQELIDLKKALDEGAINNKQYEEMIESLKESRFND